MDKLADLLLEKEEVSGEGVIELLGLKTDLQQVAESDKLGCREKTPMEGDDST